MQADRTEVFVYTEREGLMSPVGHDLKLRVTDLDVDVDGDDVTVEAAADSLRVDACIVKGREESVGRRDAKKIERNTSKDVLQSKRHPTVTYEGTIDRDDDDLTIEGTLTIRGQTNPVKFEFHRTDDEWVARTTINQRDWSIEPYTAFLGALRLTEELVLEVRVPV